LEKSTETIAVAHPTKPPAIDHPRQTARIAGPGLIGNLGADFALRTLEQANELVLGTQRVALPVGCFERDEVSYTQCAVLAVKSRLQHIGTIDVFTFAPEKVLWLYGQQASTLRIQQRPEEGRRRGIR
jgi:hypothetical protein